MAEERAGENNRDRLHYLEADFAQFQWWLDDQLKIRRSTRLVRRANRYYLPIPQRPKEVQGDNECWRWSEGEATWYLTRKGAALVTEAIREEQRARRERFLSWAPALTGLVTAIAGLLGAAIGLLAVLGRS